MNANLVFNHLRTLDYCYGVQNSLNLAAGTYKVGKSRELKSDGTPLCPDPNDPTKPGYCNADVSVDNADTLAIMAAGEFTSCTVSHRTSYFVLFCFF